MRGWFLARNFNARGRLYDVSSSDLLNSGHSFSKNLGEEKPVYVGFEWETYTAPPDTEKFLKESANTGLFGYLNFGEGGLPIEMRSVPATVAYHKRILEQEFFKNGLNRLINLKPLANNACGIHVHIDKRSFSKRSLKKFIMFICNPSNAEFIGSIAGRPIGPRVSWRAYNPCTFYYTKVGRIKTSDIKINSRLEHIDPMVNSIIVGGKNFAVNTDTCYNSIELRIFKTCRTAFSLFAKLEFTEALVYYARHATMAKLTASDFTTYVKRNGQRWPNLNKWIN